MRPFSHSGAAQSGLVRGVQRHRFYCFAYTAAPLPERRICWFVECASFYAAKSLLSLFSDSPFTSPFTSASSCAQLRGVDGFTHTLVLANARTKPLPKSCCKRCVVVRLLICANDWSQVVVVRCNLQRMLQQRLCLSKRCCLHSCNMVLQLYC